MWRAGAQNVEARKLSASQTGKLQIAQQAVRAQVTEKFD